MEEPSTSQAPRTELAPNRLKRAALIAAGLSMLGVGLTLSLAATQWYGIWRPVLIAALASAPITLVATFASAPQDRGAPARELVPVGLVSLAVSLVMGTLGGFVWREDGARTWVLEQASAHEQHELLDQIVRGGDDAFSARACAQLLAAETSGPRVRALEALEAAPGRAPACLGHLPEGRARAVAELLHERWARRLELARSAEDACTWSAPMAQLGEHSGGGAVALLECALMAEREPQRRCCMQALEGQQLVGPALAELAVRAEAPEREAQLAPVLMAGAFHQQGITEEQVARSATLELTSRPMRQYALDVACVHIDPEDTALADQFWATMRQECELGQTAASWDPAFWMGACEQRARSPEPSAQEPLTQTMCVHAKAQALRDAHREARARVIGAVPFDLDRAIGLKTERMISTIDAASQRSALFKRSDAELIEGGAYGRDPFDGKYVVRDGQGRGSDARARGMGGGGGARGNNVRSLDELSDHEAARIERENSGTSRFNRHANEEGREAEAHFKAQGIEGEALSEEINAGQERWRQLHGK